MRLNNKMLALFGTALLLLSISHVAFAQETHEVPWASELEERPREVGYTIIRGVDGAERGLFYEKVDGVAITEGDIILGNVEDLERAEEGPDGLTDGVAISGEATRWPEGVLPYLFANDLPISTRDKIADAIAHWEAQTPIRFVLLTAENQSLYPDYVRFVPADGCSSWVGRQGGDQTINLSERCPTGSIVHEIGHALGLWHEQSREDREQFIRINWENITPGRENNFSQHITDADDIGPYNYGSIMHYGRLAFSKNGLPTIETNDANAVIGQRDALSQGDIDAIHTLYGGTAPPTTSGDCEKVTDVELNNQQAQASGVLAMGGCIEASGAISVGYKDPARRDPNADIDIYQVGVTGRSQLRVQLLAGQGSYLIAVFDFATRTWIPLNCTGTACVANVATSSVAILVLSQEPGPYVVEFADGTRPPRNVAADAMSTSGGSVAELR